MATINDLIGKTFEKVLETTDSQYADEVQFILSNGKGYVFYHNQDCCESVRIEDICGDLKDLEGTEILTAEEEVNCESFNYSDSETWTFYKFSTIKGSVTIRWYGTSNGYYSESVDFREI